MMQLQPPSRRDSKLQIGRAPAGRGFRLVSSQWLPVDRADLFAFFSDAFQLQTLTPAWLHFSVLTPSPIVLQAGSVIDYRLRVHGLPLRWRSLISVWEPPFRFVDEQLRGPYRRWHHEHSFEVADGGTLCRDVVDYDVPGGALVNRLLVRRDLEKIFGFRRQKLYELFPAVPLGESA